MQPPTGKGSPGVNLNTIYCIYCTYYPYYPYIHTCIHTYIDKYTVYIIDMTQRDIRCTGNTTPAGWKHHPAACTAMDSERRDSEGIPVTAPLRHWQAGDL